MTATQTWTPAERKRAYRAGWGAFVGTTIEWYDFYVYATAAAIYFPTLFFPEQDRFVGTIAALASSAVAFFFRPLGGIIFGHIGDRLGRRPALVITLVMMGVATVAVGCLPTYAAIGVAAPILLLLFRAAQGLAVGGEWGGAALMSVESAPADKKGFFGGFTQLGNPGGALLATGIFYVMELFGKEWMMEWGWRIPFLLSAALIAVGFWVRKKTEETPVFETEVESAEQGAPVWYAIRRNWWPIILGAFIVLVPSGGYTMATTFVQNYATSPAIGFSERHILLAMTIASFVEFLVTLPVAALADKLGSKKVMYIGLIGAVVCMIPLMLAIGGQQLALTYILVSLIRIAMSATWAPLATIMAQMFRPQARYTSMSMAYGLGAALWGGLMPIVSVTLVEMTGTDWSVVWQFIVMAALNFIAMWLAPQYIDELPRTTAVKTTGAR
ncbi:MFS transporter [Canibacter zhoujuaniae]|uniref:MFS transporter n=1 Tax=Canibacter zhoujuaniae TaxID=2708343 RepID=UPI001423FB80|nr:MFS transporter [Canibacter zhoujuaniae]